MWIQCLPRGVSFGRKLSGERVDHMTIFCNTLELLSYIGNYNLIYISCRIFCILL
jgi:hypothetical protein